VGAAGSAVLIINLKSGGGKAERFDLASTAERWHLPVRGVLSGSGRGLRQRKRYNRQSK